MRKILLSAFILLLTCHSPLALAQDKEGAEKISSQVEETAGKLKDAAQDVANDVQQEVNDAADKMDDMADQASTDDRPSLLNDLKKARDIILDGAKHDKGGNSVPRGMVIALLQPLFIAAMFCLGLWAGQMSEKLKHIWALPVLLYIATLIGAFITVYHSEWKPDETQYKFLHNLQSTQAVSVAIGLVLGIVVSLQFLVQPFLALLGAIALGLVLGFSQTSDIDTQSVLPFWAGFGLTGLLVNIFGIGFETFFQSISLKIIPRLVGIATAILSVYVGSKLL